MVDPPAASVEEEIIPLSHINAHIEVTGAVALVKLEHTYQNKSDGPLKTKFVFPVDYGAAVGSLKITANGRTLKTRFVEREEAHQKFDVAVKKGDNAYLLEYDKHQEDLLEMDIGNLAPAHEVLVAIELAMKLEVVDGCLALRLAPTFVPRQHIAGSFDMGLAAAAPVVQKAPYSWKVGGSITSSGEILKLEVSSHKVEIGFSEDKRTATLSMAQDVDPTKDFSLLYRSKGQFMPQVYLQPPPKGRFAGKVAIMASYIPSSLVAPDEELGDGGVEIEEKIAIGMSEKQPRLDRSHFHFVIDSHLLEADPLMRNAVMAMAEHLPESSKLNALKFCQRKHLLSSDWLPATPSNIEKLS